MFANGDIHQSVINERRFCNRTPRCSCREVRGITVKSLYGLGEGGKGRRGRADAREREGG